MMVQSVNASIIQEDARILAPGTQEPCIDVVILYVLIVHEGICCRFSKY